MSPTSVFITGGSRGIGLELVKQYLGRTLTPKYIFVGYRTMSEELKELSDSNPSLVLVKIDMGDYNGFQAVVKQVEELVGEDGLNILINNAYFFPPNSEELDTLTPEAMVLAYEVNCVGPLFLTKALLPLLKTAAAGDSRQAAAIQMSSNVASLAENSSGKNYAYRCSKVALNMMMKNLSLDLAGTGVVTTAMMGCPDPEITLKSWCKTLLETVEGLKDEDSGAFLRYDNTRMKW